MFTRLQPILRVHDLDAERDFYLALGFTLQSQGDGFVALSDGASILFGLEQDQRADPEALGQLLTWQFGVDSVGALAEHAEAMGIPIIELPRYESWGEWTVALQSPNGFRVIFEGAQ